MITITETTMTTKREVTSLTIQETNIGFRRDCAIESIIDRHRRNRYRFGHSILGIEKEGQMRRWLYGE